jgi:predicted type IV restriction endonuclease
MFSIPKKLIERATASLKNYQKIAESHRIRDVSEADTVTLVKDILADVFGFDKYSELTSEQQIRGTFCDLAVKIDSKIRYLIEVKAAGVNLNDSHIRQAINYAVHQGVEWVILTNAVQWRLYRIKFGQPVDAEEVVSIDFLTLGTRSDED